MLDGAARTLVEAMPGDVWCGVLLDPSTLLDTGGQHESGFPQEVMGRLFEIEHVQGTDVDSLRALARRGVTASLLSRSTDGDLDTSGYYREILQPLELADELRVVLRDGEHVWGLLVLCRNQGSRPYTEDDLKLADTISRTASDTLRRSLLLAGLDTGAVPDAPGLITLDGGLAVQSLSSTAEHWLSRLQEAGRDTGPYPYAVRALAVRSRAVPPGTVVRSRAPIGAGQWLALHAWTIGQDVAPMTVMSIGPAEGGDLAAVILDVYGLSGREREVTQQVILGRSTTEIARRLGMSPYTVQDHLKSVFRKTGVQSRQELTANLFFRQYFPQLADPPLSTDGRLISGT